MIKLLVILVIVASVGKISCQDAADGNEECPFGTVKYGTGCWPQGRRSDEGCPPHMERDITTQECVEVPEWRSDDKPKKVWIKGCVEKLGKIEISCSIPNVLKYCCVSGVGECYAAAGVCDDAYTKPGRRLAGPRVLKALSFMH